MTDDDNYEDYVIDDDSAFAFITASDEISVDSSVEEIFIQFCDYPISPRPRTEEKKVGNYSPQTDREIDAGNEQKEDSFFSDASGIGDAAKSIGATLDRVAGAIDEVLAAFYSDENGGDRKEAQQCWTEGSSEGKVPHSGEVQSPITEIILQKIKRLKRWGGYQRSKSRLRSFFEEQQAWLPLVTLILIFVKRKSIGGSRRRRLRRIQMETTGSFGTRFGYLSPADPNSMTSSDRK
jgi:hypothetical protein